MAEWTYSRDAMSSFSGEVTPSQRLGEWHISCNKLILGLLAGVDAAAFYYSGYAVDIGTKAYPMVGSAPSAARPKTGIALSYALSSASRAACRCARNGSSGSGTVVGCRGYRAAMLATSSRSQVMVVLRTLK
jgi:hypothetical protein